MFSPKKRIPKLAVAMFTLTGCGDGGGGGTAGTPLNDALAAWCMNQAGCFPYSQFYQPTDYCVSYHLTYYGFNASTSAACEAAGISYFECAAELACAEFYVDNDCDALYEAANAACN